MRQIIPLLTLTIIFVHGMKSPPPGTSTTSRVLTLDITTTFIGGRQIIFSQSGEEIYQGLVRDFCPIYFSLLFFGFCRLSKYLTIIMYVYMLCWQDDRVVVIPLPCHYAFCVCGEQCSWTSGHINSSTSPKVLQV